MGPDLLSHLDEHLQRAGLQGPFLIVSQPRIIKAVGAGLRKRFSVMLVPDGERAKNLTTVSRLLDRVAALGMTRQFTVTAPGSTAGPLPTSAAG